MAIIQRTSRDGLAGLDALRGVAILLVVAAHFLPASVAALDENLSTTLAKCGVVLFFFLSGFLMERTTAHDSHFARFAIRRIARIMPMYLVSIILVQAISGPYDAKTLLSNAVLATDLTKAPMILGVYWTLYIEVRFYAVVPFLRYGGELAIKASPYAAIAANSVIIAASPHASHFLLYVTFCLAGMQISLWHRGRLSTIPLIAVLAAVSLSVGLLNENDPYLTGAAIFSAVALILVLVRKPASGALGVIGVVSYSWYLLHQIVGHKAIGLAASYGCNEWIAALIGASLSFGLAAITYRYIERPANNFGKHFSKAKLLTSETGGREVAYGDKVPTAVCRVGLSGRDPLPEKI